MCVLAKRCCVILLPELHGHDEVCLLVRDPVSHSGQREEAEDSLQFHRLPQQVESASLLPNKVVSCLRVTCRGS